MGPALSDLKKKNATLSLFSSILAMSYELNSVLFIEEDKPRTLQTISGQLCDLSGRNIADSEQIITWRWNKSWGTL